MRCQRHAPAVLYPPKDPVPIVQEAGWAPWAGLDRCGKSRPLPGFDPRTVQPVASRYTDHANRPTILAYPLFQIITTEEGGATHCLFFLSPWYRLYPGTVNRLTMNRLLRYAG